MKIGRAVQLRSKAAHRFVVLLLACLAVIPLAVACGGGEGEKTPTGTGTPAATGSPEATAVGPVGLAARQATIKPGPPPGVTDTEILLGAEVPLSGTFGAVYSTISWAVKAYFSHINDAEGGVCGRKIVYQVEDNYDDPARAVEVVRKLVEQDKVFAMVGSLGDTPHPASWEYLNENGVPDILVSAGGDRFGMDTSGHPWTVQMIPSYSAEAMNFARYISENLPGQKVAALWENDPVGIDGLAGLKKGLDPGKNQLVADQSYEVTAISISSQVANLKKSNADVVVLFSTPGFTAQAINNADRMGWYPQWLISYTSADDMIFQLVSPELLKGAITFQAVKLAAWVDDPAVARHYQLMQKYGGGTTPTNFTIYGQVLGETAVEVLKRSCDNLTREGLMEALESIKDFHTDLMLDDIFISFSETDHTGLQGGHLLRVIVENGRGKFEYFGPLYPY